MVRAALFAFGLGMPFEIYGLTRIEAALYFNTGRSWVTSRA